MLQRDDDQIWEGSGQPNKPPVPPPPPFGKCYLRIYFFSLIALKNRPISPVVVKLKEKVPEKRLFLHPEHIFRVFQTIVDVYLILNVTPTVTL